MNIVHIILLTAVAAPFIVATWAAVLNWRLPGAVNATATERIESFATTRPRFESGTLDLAVALREAAEDLAWLAREEFVRIDLAVSPGHFVRTDRDVLSGVLRGTIETAIRATPGGDVLVVARTLGSQLHIQISDDGTNSEQRLRESQARDAQALIAMQGGTIAVEVRGSRGTTVTVRLPLPADLAAPMQTVMESPVEASILAEPVA